MALPPLTDVELAKGIAKGHGCYVETVLTDHGTAYVLYKNGRIRGNETDPAAFLVLVRRVTSTRVRRRGK